MTYSNYIGPELVELQQRVVVLAWIQVESGPAETKLWPGCNGVPREEGATFLPEQREMSRRVSGRVKNLERTNPIAIFEKLVHLTRPMGTQPKREAGLQMVDAQRPSWDQCDRLRLPIAGNDIGLPLDAPKR